MKFKPLQFLSHIILILGVLLMVLPIWFSFATSTHDNISIIKEGMQFFLGDSFSVNYNEVLNEKGLKKNELIALWKDIAGNEGSVQHLDILTDDEKELFKTANEIDQIWIIEHASKRQEFICQAQSVNLFFTIPTATEPQEVHDEYMQYVNDVHWYGMNKLKSLYYFRTNAARNAENVNTKVQRIKLDDAECIACEG